MRLLVCGCRDWVDEKSIHDGLAWHFHGRKDPHEDFVIIAGEK